MMWDISLNKSIILIFFLLLLLLAEGTFSYLGLDKMKAKFLSYCWKCLRLFSIPVLKKL